MMIVVFGAWFRNVDQRRSELRRQARIRQRRCRSRLLRAAVEARLELLIGGERIAEGIFHQNRWLTAERGALRAVVVRIDAVSRCSAGGQARVITPIEADPRKLLPGLVLEVRGFVEVL